MRVHVGVGVGAEGTEDVSVRVHVCVHVRLSTAGEVSTSRHTGDILVVSVTFRYPDVVAAGSHGCACCHEFPTHAVVVPTMHRLLPGHSTGKQLDSRVVAAPAVHSLCGGCMEPR